MSENTLKSYGDYERRMMERGIPSSVMLEITYLCNLRCQFCYNPTHEAIGEMSTKDILYCFDEIARLGVPQIVLTGGECMAHRDFFFLLEEAHKRQFSIEIFTNAALIDKPTAERLMEYPITQLSTSIHGDNAATHDELTCVPGSFDKLLKALEYLQGAPFKRELKNTVTRKCQDQLRGMKAIADRYGCHKIKFDFEIIPRDNGDTSPVEDTVSEEFRRLYYSEAYDDVRYGGVEAPSVFPEGQPFCGTGLTQFTIDPYGNVFPCILFRRYIGNILKDGLEKIWFGENKALEEVRETTKRISRESFSREDIQFAHFCAGFSDRMTGNPMHVFEEEREAIKLRRERYLKELVAMKADPSRASKLQAREAE